MSNSHTHAAPPRPGRIVALVLACLLLLPAVGSLVAGGALLLGHLSGRDADGFHSTTLDRVESSAVAVTSPAVDLTVEPDTPGWLVDALDADIRLRVTSASGEVPVFVGIGAQEDVDRYLRGVAHDEIQEVQGRTPMLTPRSGGTEVARPTAQTFWVASASGTGAQEIVWPATPGRWAAVVMNATATPGVAVDVMVGARIGAVAPVAATLLVVGAALIAVSVAGIVWAAHGLGAVRPGVPVPPAPTSGVAPTSPVRLEAHLDPELSRAMWLIKWGLAIPHVVVLSVLWLAFVVLTVVAGVSVLFTGRYPRGIFDFNVGVLRWTWRVSFYATSGGLGTDRYPPFSLQPDPTYPADLDIEYPERLSRGLVLVKWWLLVIPHLLVISVLSGGATWTTGGEDALRIGSAGGGGLLGLLVLVAAVILLVRQRYPRPLFDLIIGLNRWIYRVIAYAALMTDTYPPFRLDQGGSEPVTPPPLAPDAAPTGDAAVAGAPR